MLIHAHLKEASLLRSVALIILFDFSTGCGRGQRPLSALSDEFSGNQFYFFDASDRAVTMKDLKNLTLANYTLLDVKKAREIVIDGGALFDEAIQLETDRDDPTTTDVVSQAQSNSAFLDQIQGVIAAFQDTHFGASPLVPRPTILNGLILARVGDEVRIVGTRAPVISYVKDPGDFGSGLRLCESGGEPPPEALTPSAAQPSFPFCLRNRINLDHVRRPHLIDGDSRRDHDFFAGLHQAQALQ